MIVGVTGLYCSGKDTVAEILIKKSFYHYSLSDAIREEAKKRKKELTRQNLIDIGNELRSIHGPGILAQRALQAMQSDKNYVITSIRSPGEVEVLKQRKDFVLINVDAPTSVRFERLKKRGKAATEDKKIKTLADFKKSEESEMSANPAHQQLHKVLKMADVTILNDKDISILGTKIDKFLSQWGPKLQLPRPNWDEYFMTIAQTVARRSNCVKRKVGTVVIKDKRIISTGYNGTPRGTKNCDEGGCPRCNSYAAAGTNLGDCLCSHAEENAIVQAAYHGVSLKGGVLYTTFSPCVMCAKMIINAGIIELVYNVDYPLPDSAKNLYKEAGVKVRQFKTE